MRVFAPGRVNLIGDHVDYMGGLVMPMAIDLGTTIDIEASGRRLRLSSDQDPQPADLELPVTEIGSITGWGRYVAAVAAELGATVGGRGHVTSTLPVGAGLSSSASLEVAVALALGAELDPLALARLCQRAEQRATGVRTGIMDQLTITSARPDAALLIDCRDHSVEAVALPRGSAVHAVPSGVTRRLEGSEYGRRRAACEAAETIIGSLRDASVRDLSAIDDGMVRARARHVITEIARVQQAARADDAAELGRLMNASHASLRDDFAVSLPVIDQLVDSLMAIPGVYGARITGGGFGGCVVALVDDDLDPGLVGGWRLRPCGAAAVID